MADAIHREVAESTAKVLSMLPLSAPGHAERASEAFKEFRLAVLHATGSRDLPVEAFLDSVEEKDLIVQFLSEFAGKKRMYKKQIVAVFESLLEVDSWLWILVHNDALACSLQDDMKDVFEKARAARPNPAPPPAPPTATEVAAAAEPPPMPVDGYSLEGLLAKARLKADAEEVAAGAESAPAPAPAVEEPPAPAPTASTASVPATSSTAEATPAAAEALPSSSAVNCPRSQPSVESGRETSPPDASAASPPAREEAADDLPRHSVQELTQMWESKRESADDKAEDEAAEKARQQAEAEAAEKAEAEAAEKARQQAEDEKLAREESAQKAKEAAEAEAAATARLKAEEEERRAREAEEAKRKQQEEEEKRAREAKEAAEAEAAAKAKQQAEEEERRAREAEEAKRTEEEEKRAKEEERQAKLKAIEAERAAEAERKYAEWIKSEEERKAREAAEFAAMPVPEPAKPEDFFGPSSIWGKTEEASTEKPPPAPAAPPAPPAPPVETSALRMAVRQAWASAGSEQEEDITGTSPSKSPSGEPASRPPPRLHHDVGHTVSQFQEAVDMMQNLNFSAERRDPASDAFNQFYKSVLKTFRSATKEDDEELERLEPKADIVSFLVDVQTKRSNMESRVGAVLNTLEEFESWRAVIQTHRDPVVTKTVRELVSKGAAEKESSEVRGRGDAMPERPPTSTVASDAGRAPLPPPAAAPAAPEPGGLSAWMPWLSSRKTESPRPSVPVTAVPPARASPAAPTDTAVHAAVRHALAGADPPKAEPKKEWVVWYSIDPRKGKPEFYKQEVASMLENGRRRGQKSVDITAFMPCDMKVEFEPRLCQQTKGGSRDVIRDELSSPTESVTTYVNRNKYNSWQAATSHAPGAEERTSRVPSGHAVSLR